MPRLENVNANQALWGADVRSHAPKDTGVPTVGTNATVPMIQFVIRQLEAV